MARVTRSATRSSETPLESGTTTTVRSGGRGKTILRGPDGGEISYTEWKQQQMAAWAARESEPGVIDSIGVAETIALAKARFEGTVGDYLLIWAETSGNSDDFGGWLVALVGLIEREMANLWDTTEWHRAWFNRAGREPITNALRTLKKQWESKASALEIQHLENPHLSIKSLLSADGNLSFALTLEQGTQAIESTQELLRKLKTPYHHGGGGPQETAGLAAESDLGNEEQPNDASFETIDPLADISSRRPLGDNPYPKDDRRHDTFEQANWEAEKDLGDLKLELFRRFDASTRTPAEVLQILLTYRLTRFDAVASRGRQTVDDGETARRYEDWLRAAATFDFEDILRKLARPTSGFPHGLIPILDVEGFRFIFMQMVEKHQVAALAAVQSERTNAAGVGNSPNPVRAERSIQNFTASDGAADAHQATPVSAEVAFDQADSRIKLQNTIDQFVSSVQALESIDFPDLVKAFQPISDAALALEEIESVTSNAAVQEALEASGCALEGSGFGSDSTGH